MLKILSKVPETDIAATTFAADGAKVGIGLMRIQIVQSVMAETIL